MTTTIMVGHVDNDYRAFLARKTLAHKPAGFTASMNPAMFQFQLDLAAMALRRGRAAIFAGTGLGKTIMQWSWADAVRRERGPVLILTPLAVAHQTVNEAA